MLTKTLHIPAAWLQQVHSILNQHLPDAEILAYGSRVNGDYYDASDVDLAARFPATVEKLKRITRLDAAKEAFVESNLPIIVQIVDWDAIPQSFRDEILAGYVIVQNMRHIGHMRRTTSECALRAGSRWPMVRLGDYCVKIGSGATPKGGKEAYLESGPYSLIRSQNVYNGGFSWDGLAYISHEQAKKLDGVAVNAGDVLLNITGDSVARVCSAPERVIPARVNQHVAIIRPDKSSFDPRFIRYFLASPKQQDLLLGMASAGATRNALTKGMIEDLRIPKPTMAEQTEIAKVLVSLDEKILLLSETNTTLEAIAQALFKSWFVYFDPVRAKATGREPEGVPPEIAELFPSEFEESELGEIPKGWQKTRVGDVLELAYGKALKATERIEGDVPVYGSGGITGFHNQALVDGPSIIVGRKGTVGSLYWEDRKFFPIDTVFFVRPLKAPLSYCYYMLQTLGLGDMNTDAAVPGLNRENVYRLKVSLPSGGLLELFDEHVSLLREKIFTATEESRGVSAIRDSLLPKLMTGTLKIERESA